MENIRINNALIAKFMGYIYFEPDVLVDNSDIGGVYDATDIYSKVPIEVDDYPEHKQKYFKDLPNPDYGNTESVRWASNIEELSWDTLNWGKYITDLKYHESFDWLMPVVDKIEKKYDVSISTWRGLNGQELPEIVTLVDICHPNHIRRVIPRKNNVNKLHAIYHAVVDFIKWHNSPVNRFDRFIE